MVIFLIGLVLFVGGVACGIFYGNEVLRMIQTARGKPFMITTVKNTSDESVAIDSEFNSLFIYELDRIYRAKGSDLIDPLQPSNEKVALYMYDVFSNIAEQYLPEEAAGVEDIDKNVPPMGTPVRQVVDLDNMPSRKGKSEMDIEQG